MKKPIAILFFAMFLITAFGQVDSLKNASLIGQASRNQKVGQGFQIGFVGSSDDTCQINTKLQIVPNAGEGKVLTSDANGFGTWTTPSFWKLTGNASTTPGTNFIGTTDAKDFITKTNGTIRQQISAGGSYYITADTNYNWTAQRYLGTAGNAKIYAGSNVLGYGVDGFSLGYKNFGALAVGGNLTALGRGDSAIYLFAKSVGIKCDSAIEITGKEVVIKSDSVITITGNGIISGSNNSINKANSFTANAIVASSNCHLDSGANMSIIASHQSAVRGLSSNPGNNPAHTVILGGYADTVYSYHQIAFGPQAVTKRITYANASGWDNRDLLFSFGNSPRSDSANVAFEQSAIIMNKKGHIAFGEALDSTQIPDTTGALAKFYGSIAITDGSENTGNVLTSDAYGNATWQTYGYGEMGFGDSAVTVNLTINTPTKATNATNNLWLNGARDTLDVQYSGDSLIVLKDGTYTINGYVCMEGANGAILTTKIYLNGALLCDCNAYNTLSANRRISIPFTDIKTLSAGDVLEVYVENISDNTDVVMVSGKILVTQIRQ